MFYFNTLYVSQTIFPLTLKIDFYGRPLTVNRKAKGQIAFEGRFYTNFRHAAKTISSYFAL
jgi:hypothetical protein